jgi:hypothetical protein
MCIGIAIVGIVPADGGPIQFFGKEGNSSHDTVLSESVPVELHNRSFKIEYLFPSRIRLDAPDKECQTQAIEFGIAEIKFGVAVLKTSVFASVCDWLRVNPLQHDLKTMQEATLEGANLGEADLREANLREANLGEANLGEANLSRANLREANLSRADLREANLSRANLEGANLSRADLRGANLLEADKNYAKEHGAIVDEGAQ